MSQLAEQWMGIPLMPWQRYVVNRALEVDPITHRLAYREVGLTVPRQSGKSTLILMLMLHRAFETGVFGQRQRMVYGAQTGKDARKKWEQDYVEALDSAPRMMGRYKVTRQSGHEAIIFPKSRSRFGLSTNTKKAGHGTTLDLAFLDEAFAQPDDRLEQAYKPAMVTRPSPQFWVVSTAGDEDSHYLRRKVDRGRDLALQGSDRGIAYFEWSAPDDADPSDPATWHGCMPAMGQTVTEDTIRDEFEGMELDEFRRAYLNQWVAKGGDAFYGPGVWEGLADYEADVEDRFVFGIDTTPERTVTSIGLAGTYQGKTFVDLGLHQAGTRWVVEACQELQRKHPEAVFAIDEIGPAASLIPEIEDARIPLVKLTTQACKRASGWFFDEVTTGNVTHLNNTHLNAAVAGAKKRSVGDAWLYDRKKSAVISPLVAVTWAAWCLANSGPSVYESRGAVLLG